MEKKIIPVSLRVKALFSERKTFIFIEFCQLLIGLSAFYKIVQDCINFCAIFEENYSLKNVKMRVFVKATPFSSLWSWPACELQDFCVIPGESTAPALPIRLHIRTPAGVIAFWNFLIIILKLTADRSWWAIMTERRTDYWCVISLMCSLWSTVVCIAHWQIWKTCVIAFCALWKQSYGIAYYGPEKHIALPTSDLRMHSIEYKLS